MVDEENAFACRSTLLPRSLATFRLRLVNFRIHDIPTRQRPTIFFSMTPMCFGRVGMSSQAPAFSIVSRILTSDVVITCTASTPPRLGAVLIPAARCTSSSSTDDVVTPERWSGICFQRKVNNGLPKVVAGRGDMHYRVCIVVIRSQKRSRQHRPHPKSQSHGLFIDVEVGDCRSTTTQVSTTRMGLMGCAPLLAVKF